MSTIHTAKTVSQTLGRVIKNIDKLSKTEARLSKIASLAGKLDAEVNYQVDSLATRVAGQKAKAKAAKQAEAEEKAKAKAEKPEPNTDEVTIVEPAVETDDNKEEGESS